MKKYLTIKEWKTKYPNQIVFATNERIEIIDKENDNSKWKGWIFCKSQSKSAWVPEQIILMIGQNKGIIKEHYSAKELNVNKGEKVCIIRELNGWAWVKKNLDNDEGWLPLEILKKIE